MSSRPPAHMVPPILMLAVLLAASLLTGSLVGPAQATGHDDLEVRLYGCGDDATRAAGAGTGPDGLLDCPGDRLQAHAAWLSSTSDPVMRRALGGLDERIDLGLRYHPEYWAPAPAAPGPPAGDPSYHPPAIADPAAAIVGLLDRGTAGTPGRFDPVLLDDETHDPRLDEDSLPEPIDLVPHDGRPDRAPANMGEVLAADRYFPAVSATYTMTWWRDGDATAAVPNMGRLAFPGVHQEAMPGPRADVWTDDGPPALHWVARPLGAGTGGDGLGALVTPPITLAHGERVWLFDHGFRLAGTQAGSGIAYADVLFRHAQGTQVIGRGFELRTEGAAEVATLESLPTGATNVVLGGHASVSQRIPEDWIEPMRDGPGTTFFALVESVDAASGEATVRLGRIVADHAPWNAAASGDALYTIDTLLERQGSLQRLAWTQVMPIAQPMTSASAPLDLTPLSLEAPIPLLSPFDSEHLVTRDAPIPLELDRYGFADVPGNDGGQIDRGSIPIVADARTQADRARSSPPLVVYLEDHAHEPLLAANAVQWFRQEGEGVGVPLAHRYVQLSWSDATMTLHSSLLPGSSRVPTVGSAPRLLLLDPGRVPEPPLYHGGVRLYGATTRADDVASVMRFTPAMLRSADYQDATGTREGPLDQRIQLELEYRPYHPFNGRLRLAPVSDEAIDRGIDPDADDHMIEAARGDSGDNLHDVQPRHDAPDGITHHAPALLVRHTYGWTDPATWESRSIPFGPDAQVLFSAASHPPRHAGAESFDLLGAGGVTPTVLEGYWETTPGEGQDAGWRTAPGGFDAGTDPASADLLHLATPTLSIGRDQELRFFDHAMRFIAFGDGAATLHLMDLRARGDPRPLGSADVVSSQGARCIGVYNSGAAELVPVPCDQVTVAPRGGGAPGSEHLYAWFEVLDAGAAEVAVRAHRVVSTASYALPHDPGQAIVDGVRLRLAEVQLDQEGVRSVTWESDVPVGSDAMVRTGPGGRLVGLSGMDRGGLVPLPAPFWTPHWTQDTIQERRELDRLGWPTGDTLREVRRVTPLTIQVAERAQDRGDRFVAFGLDRAVAPTPFAGPGLFVSHLFADPAGTVPRTDPRTERLPPAFAVAGNGRVPGVIHDAAARGWDHYVSLDIVPGHGSVALVTSRVAGVEAHGSAAGTVGPVARGMVLFDPRVPRDLYFGDVPEAPVAVPSPGPVNGTDPVDPGDEPAAQAPEGLPGVPVVWVLVTLGAGLFGAGRRRGVGPVHVAAKVEAGRDGDRDGSSHEVLHTHGR